MEIHLKEFSIKWLSNVNLTEVQLAEILIREMNGKMTIGVAKLFDKVNKREMSRLNYRSLCYVC